MTNKTLKYVRYLESKWTEGRIYKFLFWGLLVLVLIGNLLPGLLAFLGVVCLATIGALVLSVFGAYIVHQHSKLILSLGATFAFAFIPKLFSSYYGLRLFDNPTYEEVFRYLCFLTFLVVFFKPIHNRAAYMTKTHEG
ncbi:hypothetical protein [Candidatus Odyssella thessalonicensis]|uniref:hypothetical protein n=1 Tax=Candidatus Odyssella thessalonicensis TaxID=84647 RepID=UPI000225AF87|nr:hypothetical protein [Candidatus Odyssella thessalonicensis]